MLLVSIANGTLRDFTYGRQLGELAAHQVSTASGMLLIGGIIWCHMRRSPPRSRRHAWGLGLFWMMLTISFEFLFFHYIGGHSWAALRNNYNLTEGRIWVVLLAWIALAPAVFFRLPHTASSPKESS